mmetsp:Transcript_72368/g.198233  ORF Transcript_72368/g.198233 Transcript_72368/m.198233 type:complete len:142 (-) Transcript_72368:1411-1836(-)
MCVCVRVCDVVRLCAHVCGVRLLCGSGMYVRGCGDGKCVCAGFRDSTSLYARLVCKSDAAQHADPPEQTGSHDRVQLHGADAGRPGPRQAPIARAHFFHGLPVAGGGGGGLRMPNSGASSSSTSPYLHMPMWLVLATSSFS